MAGLTGCSVYAQEEPRLEITHEGKDVHISWASKPGESYRVLSKNTLLDTPWYPLHTILGTGEIITHTQQVVSVSKVYSVEARANPLYQKEFYVDPNSHAKAQVRAWQSTRPDDTLLMDKIARNPQAFWFVHYSSDVDTKVRAVVSKAANAGEIPILCAYMIPKRDCGSYSGGGAPSADAYKVWSRKFTQGIGDNEAVVIVEPDAVALWHCLNAEERATRSELLREFIVDLKTNSGAIVYLDAAHSYWHPAGEMIRRLKEAGAEHADGFSLNVSNFRSQRELIAYGEQISRGLNGKHFILDTSRNGQGPAPDSALAWCNPPGRALGIEPTWDTDHPLIDAFLWIKRPGESDGACRPGEPNAGVWWPEYALGLASRAAY